MKTSLIIWGFYALGIAGGIALTSYHVSFPGCLLFGFVCGIVIGAVGTKMEERQ